MLIPSFTTMATMMMFKGLVCNPFPVSPLSQNTKNKIENEINFYLQNKNRFEETSIIDNSIPTPTKNGSVVTNKISFKDINKVVSYLFNDPHYFSIQACEDKTCNDLYATVDGKRKIIFYSTALLEKENSKELFNFILIHELSHLIFESVLAENQGKSFLNNTTLNSVHLPDPPEDFEMNHFNDSQFTNFRNEISEVRHQATKSHAEVDLIAIQIMEQLNLPLPDNFSNVFYQFLNNLKNSDSTFSLPSDDFFQCLGENELNYRTDSIKLFEQLRP